MMRRDDKKRDEEGGMRKGRELSGERGWERRGGGAEKGGYEGSGR